MLEKQCDTVWVGYRNYLVKNGTNKANYYLMNMMKIGTFITFTQKILKSNNEKLWKLNACQYLLVDH